MAGHRLSSPIVGMAATPSGHGYILLGADGGIFTFGNARFHGSTGGMHLNARVLDLAMTANGKGYWFVAADGGVFTFGNARFHGSTGNLHLNSPVMSMTSAASGKGYWMVGYDGGIFAFNVPFEGSMPAVRAPDQRPARTDRAYARAAFGQGLLPARFQRHRLLVRHRQELRLRPRHPSRRPHGYPVTTFSSNRRS